MRKIAVFSIFSLIIMMSCTINRKKILGSYSFKGEYVIDTLIIKNHIFIHKIYDKNLQLKYKEEGEWTLENNRITLLKFYNNEDNELEEPLSNEDAKKFLMITSFPVYEQKNDIIMEVNADENIFYKKIPARVGR